MNTPKPIWQIGMQFTWNSLTATGHPSSSLSVLCIPTGWIVQHWFIGPDFDLKLKSDHLVPDKDHLLNPRYFWDDTVHGKPATAHDEDGIPAHQDLADHLHTVDQRHMVREGGMKCRPEPETFLDNLPSSPSSAMSALDQVYELLRDRKHEGGWHLATRAKPSITNTPGIFLNKTKGRSPGIQYRLVILQDPN